MQSFGVYLRQAITYRSCIKCVTYPAGIGNFACLAPLHLSCTPSALLKCAETNITTLWLLCYAGELQGPALIRVALLTLGTFDFGQFNLLEFVRDHVMTYLDDPDVSIRRSSAAAAAQVLQRHVAKQSQLQNGRIHLNGQFVPITKVSTLCCLLLCCDALFCAALCHAVPCCAVLCHAVLCCPVMRYAVLCHAMLSCAMLCRAMLCRAMLCRAMLCRALPPRVMLCSVLCHAVMCSVVLRHNLPSVAGRLKHSTCGGRGGAAADISCG